MVPHAQWMKRRIVISCAVVLTDFLLYNNLIQEEKIEINQGEPRALF